MINHKIITRKGRIVNTEHISNKCKSSDHPIFFYTLRIVFKNTTDLDENGFIIDHDLINEEIVNNVEVRSCELLADDILDTIKRLMKRNKIGISAMKITINPVLPIPNDAGAFIEQVWAKDAIALTLL